MREKLDELARLHEFAMAEIHGPKNEQFVAECYRSIPALLEYVRGLEGERDRWKAAYADLYSGEGGKSRDTQQRREGAKESDTLWRIMYEPSFLGITAMTAGNFKVEIYGLVEFGETPAAAIEQAAKRFREAK